ncbi:MAG: dihydrodipicolinate synthase family protein [Clostridia bacterium]|nr:dihydrodipicolinate synthase family protein [Clostridia bacterium]
MGIKYNFGAYPTMITPYTDDGKVDYETARKYVRWYYENGCDGIFAVCQSSEIFYLSLEERVKLNKSVYDEVNKLSENGGRRMTVVSSGHVSDTLEEQAHELNMIL